MGHQTTALIGSRSALSQFTEQFGSPATTELVDELVIMPLDDLRLELLRDVSAPPYEGFAHLTSEVTAGILTGVGSEKTLYIETEYFGGTGSQGAAFFRGGKLIWKRSISSEDRSELPDKTPISEGLAELGVRSSDDRDKFDVAGLSRFRSLESLGVIEWEDED
jgi:hypothetical protein